MKIEELGRTELPGCVKPGYEIYSSGRLILIAERSSEGIALAALAEDLRRAESGELGAATELLLRLASFAVVEKEKRKDVINEDDKYEPFMNGEGVPLG